MLAAGTGITPMYQALLRIFEQDDDDDKEISSNNPRIRNIHLFYGCKTKADILLYDELEEMQRKHPDQLKIHYAISSAQSLSNLKHAFRFGPRIKFGRICKEDLMEACKDILPWKGNNAVDCRVWVCGPETFYENFSGTRGDKALPPSCVLGELGFKPNQVIKF